MDHLHTISRRTVLKGAAAVPVAGLGLAAVARNAGAQGEPVKVGSKDFPEQFILANLMSQVLEANGIKTNLDGVNLGGTGIAHKALTNGDIDVYMEYTGTAYTFDGIFGQTFPLSGDAASATPAGTPAAASTPAAGGAFSAADMVVYNYDVDAYGKLDLVMLDQTPFNDSQALGVMRQFSEDNNITTISQLAAWGNDNKITISAPVDFEDRADGLAGLKKTYGEGFENAEVNGVDPGIKYDAFTSGDANVVLAFGTDAEIKQYDIVVLQDDKALFPPGHAAPVFRKAVIDAYPNIPDLLNPVMAKLTADAMIGMNTAVVTNGDDPADAAKQFLTSAGIITG